jgi:dihydroorotate dehydrogenase (fumarate)
MMTSALLRGGPEHLGLVKRELVTLLEERGHASPAELRGSMSGRNIPDPAGSERASSMRTLASWASHQPVGPGHAGGL